jgi:hypothetical protein
MNMKKLFSIKNTVQEFFQQMILFNRDIAIIFFITELTQVLEEPCAQMPNTV